jgi:hypothetical protein
MVFNAFAMEPGEVEDLRTILRGSNTTVVWMYAPAYLSKNGTSLDNMSRLTGFEFDVVTDKGLMLIDYGGTNLRFGTGAHERPRFITTNHDEVIGTWSDSGLPAFTSRQDEDGWTSIYCGTAPLPSSVMRDLVERSSARLWSTTSDIIVATHDTAMVVATEPGERTITFPLPVKMLGNTELHSDKHTVNLSYGDVLLFQR